jgi:uncharacterized protein YciI
MPLYAFIGTDGPRGIELRKIHREAHLAGLDELVAQDRIAHAGPLLDSNGGPVGSVVIFEADGLDAARAIAARDPDVTEGIFERWQLHETKVVRGRG